MGCSICGFLFPTYRAAGSFQIVISTAAVRPREIAISICCRLAGGN